MNIKPCFIYFSMFVFASNKIDHATESLLKIGNITTENFDT